MNNATPYHRRKTQSHPIQLQICWPQPQPTERHRQPTVLSLSAVHALRGLLIKPPSMSGGSRRRRQQMSGFTREIDNSGAFQA